MNPSRNQPCPCGSGKKFKHCCAERAVGTQGAGDSLDEALKHHQAGRLAEAATLYKRIVVKQPDHADALHLLGMTYYGMGQGDLAFETLQSAIRLNPGAAAYYSNLAEICQSLGRQDEAVEAAQRACVLQPGLPEAHFQLGKALRALKHNEQAAQALQQALALKPAWPEASLLRARALHALKQSNEALACLEAANAMSPGHAGLIKAMGDALRLEMRHDEAIAYYQSVLQAFPVFAGSVYGELAECYKAIGELDRAADSYRKALEIRPNDENVRHHLQAVVGEASDAPPLGYVRDLFDQYADTFDDHLVKTLEYRTHALLGEAICGWTGTVEASLDCLDLGCGTGLLAPEIHAQCHTLAGCDLSPRMVELARRRNLYDRLEVADLSVFLSACADASVNLVAAADVFVYLGQLAEVFAQSRRVLRPGGGLAFSVELLDSPERDYMLRTSGRYAHAPAYIECLCAEHDFRVVLRQAVTLRKEANVPMLGYLYIVEAGQAPQE